MKKIVLLFVIFTFTFSVAQENYKYVIVPKKFSFFSEENEFNTNLITKAFFEKEGFVVYYEPMNFLVNLQIIVVWRYMLMRLRRVICLLQK